MKKLRWGVLGTSRIARVFVIPAIQESEANEVVAIASRSLETAEAVAADFDIGTAYGAYDELLADPNIDVIYNPLPNHLHVPLSVRALEAGKHVLCEKPLGLSADDVQPLLQAAEAHPQLNVMEAFMYRFHPQWRKVQKMVDEQVLGTVRTVHAQFTYYKNDADNIRSKFEYGGGGLLDIGCYCISAARLLFNDEPVRVSASITRHPEWEVDILTSCLMEFPTGTATFSCATLVEHSQLVHASGELGSLAIKAPFVAPADGINRMTVTHDRVEDELEFDDTVQYMDMVDAFAQAIINGEPAPIPLADALANMKVLDAVAESARTGSWARVH